MHKSSLNYPDFKKYNTFPKILKYRSDITPNDIALRDKDLGIWNETSWKDYNQQVSELAIGLNSIGFRKGDVMALIGDNKPSWVFFEIAAQANGGMSLGVYRDTLDEEVSYLVKGANVNFAFAEDQEQVDKFINIQKKLKRRIKIFYEDGRGLRQLKDSNIVDMKILMEKGRNILKKSPKKYDDMINNIEGHLDAILCTTSGTTSNPKLATLPANKFIQHIANYLKVDPKNSTDEYVSVLPFPWIMEQDYGVGFLKVSTDEDYLDQVVKHLRKRGARK